MVVQEVTEKGVCHLKQASIFIERLAASFLKTGWSGELEF